MMERMKRRELDFMDVSNDDNDNDEQERQSVVPFLSDDIIFVILSWAPAKFLYESGKLVRKSWNRIITSTLFEEKHFSQLNPIDIFFKIPAVQFYEDQRFRRVDITEMEILWHSSAGLMLYDDVKNKTLLVKNPITKQISTLPYPPFPITDSKCKLNVVYLPRTREVKVIQNYRIPSLQNLQCFRNLLTVGTVSNKSWRILDSKITDQTIVPSDLFYSSSIGSVVIYWTTSNLFQSITFLAVDLQGILSRSSCAFNS